MTEYSVRNYNFDDDEEFQKFFKSKRPKEWLKPNKYYTVYNYYKRKWISILNDVILRSNHNLPMDWGEDYII